MRFTVKRIIEGDISPPLCMLSKKTCMIDKLLVFQNKFVILFYYQKFFRMVEKMKNITTLTLRMLTSVACAFLFVLSNVTCIGPGYQPQLPKSADKFRIK